MKPVVKPFIVSLIDVVNLGFLCVLIGFLIVTYTDNPYSNVLMALYLVILLSIFGIAKYRNHHQTVKYNLFYLLSAVILFITMYESISGLLPIFVGNLRFDAMIDNLDKSVFGISPTVWMQRIIFPSLTEVLYILYFVYFFMPVILVILLYRNGEFKELEISLFTLFINYYGAYISYFYIPVEGPRYYLAHEHVVPLDGIFLSEPLRDFINLCEPSTLDCFPSLHSSILVVVTALAYKFYPRIFKIYLVLSIVIIFSLVYLRYHYLLDIVFGALWAGISLYLAHRIFSLFSNRFNSHFVVPTL